MRLVSDIEVATSHFTRLFEVSLSLAANFLFYKVLLNIFKIYYNYNLIQLLFELSINYSSNNLPKNL